MKTFTLIERVKWLLENDYKPEELLLVTFTNNAAKEMVNRIRDNRVLACTFHSLCYRILREFLPRGRRPFVVIDEEDQSKLIKSIMTENRIVTSLEDAMNHINLMQSKGIRHSDEWIYNEYVRVRDSHNMFDFGSMQIDALEFAPSISGRWKCILIDEYQDTDPVQWELTKILEEGCENITVVCDDQQSIYGWRGADIENIMKFTRTYNSKVLRLSNNYRSTNQVVNVVNRLVRHATEKLHDKELISMVGDGPSPRIITYQNDIDEARGIANMIASTGNPSSNMVLYRANWLSRQIETQLMLQGIPYTVVDGVGFYRRREVKDILCYLRYAYNMNDEVAIRRIINVPCRGIGKVTVDRLIKEYGSLSASIMKSNDNRIVNFRKMILEIRSLILPHRIMEHTLKLTNYMEYIDEEYRKNNVMTLIDGALAFGGSTDDYLMMVSLLSSTDNMDDDNTVKLMTIHASKGMEAENVYVVGMEDGLIPHGLNSNIEEERRLLYVAISRAKRGLILTNTVTRWRFGKVDKSIPSRFIEEIRS